MGLMLLMKFFLVGLGDGEGVKVVLLTGICIDGEKHCFAPEHVGEGDPHTILE